MKISFSIVAYEISNLYFKQLFVEKIKIEKHQILFKIN